MREGFIKPAMQQEQLYQLRLWEELTVLQMRLLIILEKNMALISALTNKPVLRDCFGQNNPAVNISASNLSGCNTVLYSNTAIKPSKIDPD